MTTIPTTRHELLSIDPETLDTPLPWEALLCPRSLVGSWDAWTTRRTLGLSETHGVQLDQDEKSRAYAAACMISGLLDDPMPAERDRLRAVQEVLRHGYCALHALSVVYGTLSECPCADCSPMTGKSPAGIGGIVIA